MVHALPAGDDPVVVDELALLDGEPHFPVVGDGGALQVDGVAGLPQQGQVYLRMGWPVDDNELAYDLWVSLQG